jgi:hypothetical protein
VFLPCLCFFCDCLDYIVSAISFLFLPVLSFLLKESVRQLCVACKVSLYVYFAIALLKNTYSRGIVTDGHHNISIRVSSDQAVFIRYIAFRTLKDSLPDRDGIRTHGIFAFPAIDHSGFFLRSGTTCCAGMQHHLTICNHYMRTALGEVRVNDFGDD